MSTVLRVGGYPAVIHTRDHPPSHAHVLLGGDEEEVVIDLAPVSIREIRGMRLQNIVAAVRIVEDHAAFRIGKWMEIHD